MRSIKKDLHCIDFLSLGFFVRATTFLSILLSIFIAGIVRAHLPENFADLSDDVQAVILEYAFFPEQATKIWGQDYEAPSPHQMVKYLDDYHTKVNVNFAQGSIRIESERSKTPITTIKNAIVATLLTPANPNSVDLYTATDMGLTGTPFLHGLVLDNQRRSISNQAQAERYANQLVNTHLQRRGARYWVDIPMVKSYKSRSADHFHPLVMQASSRYRVEPALIYAIMETESSFNPFAVSPVGAYGLMQVMQHTAGRDVFEKIYNKRGSPSRNYLLDPAKNIDAGTAYISILRDRYLRGVNHPLSREYCIIAAYNGGTGNLLKAFHKDRNVALARINKMSPQAVYNRIVSHHPHQESRNYLYKVTNYKQKYVR